MGCKTLKKETMLTEMVNQIKRQAVKETMCDNIELKYMFPNKESFVNALNTNDQLLMKLLPRLLRLPKTIRFKSVDYISTIEKTSKGKGKEKAEEEQREMIIHVSTLDCSQSLIIKKDINQVYEKLASLRMCFAFRLEDSYTTKEWYDYN